MSLRKIWFDNFCFNTLFNIFVRRRVKSNLQLVEAEAARWLKADELMGVDWLPADKEVVAAIFRQ